MITVLNLFKKKHTHTKKKVATESLLHSTVQCKSTQSSVIISEMSPCRDQKEHLKVCREKYVCK